MEEPGISLLVFSIKKGTCHNFTGAFWKAAPSIPGVVLQEPILFNHEFGSFLQQQGELFLATDGADDQRQPEIQTEHFHKAFAVDPVLLISHGDGEGMLGGDGYKLQNIFDRTDVNLKFFHKHLRTVQIVSFRV